MTVAGDAPSDASPGDAVPASAARASWFARTAFERGGLLGLATLVLYIALAPSHVVDGDNGEFATLGAVGGVAHPSGYPLYVLWLRATAWVPGASPAHTAAIATALLGAASVVVLHAACRAWGARVLATTIAVTMFACAPIVVRVASEAEVFALNGLVVATVVWLAAAAGPLRGVKRALVLGLVAGLGMSNHLSCVLIAPVGVLGLVRATREARVPRPATVTLAVVGLGVGLVPYVYLLVAPATLSWGPIEGLTGGVRHFLRLDYGGPGAFAAHGSDISLLANLGALARTLGRVWLWAPGFVGIYVLIARSVRAGTGESRAAWATLATSFVLAGPWLVSRFDIPLTGAGLFVDQRFYLLSALLLAIPVAVGLERVLARVERRGVQVALPVVTFLAISATSVPYVQRGHTAAVEACARNTLRGLPRDAVAIVADNDGIGYVQHVLGERADVVVVMWPMMPVATYRARIAQQLGLVLPQGGDAQLSIIVTDQLLAHGRPVFVDGVEANVLRTFPTVPAGLLFHVLPRGAALPSIQEVYAANRALYASFEFGYPAPNADDDYAAEVHVRYARTWYILASALRSAGRRDDAADAEELAHQLEPRP